MTGFQDRLQVIVIKSLILHIGDVKKGRPVNKVGMPKVSIDCRATVMKGCQVRQPICDSDQYEPATDMLIEADSVNTQ